MSRSITVYRDQKGQWRFLNLPKGRGETIDIGVSVMAKPPKQNKLTSASINAFANRIVECYGWECNSIETNVEKTRFTIQVF